MSDLPPLDKLLAYDRHLEGEAFTRRVMIRTSRRGRRRWILGGSALVSLAVVMGIKPDNFTLLGDFHLPPVFLDATASVPAGGLVLVLLVTALVVGASKTVDSL